MVAVKIPLADTHCHLDFKTFAYDREAVIERAREAGVFRFLVPGIDIDSSRAAIHLADQFPEVYIAAGVHPNCGLTWDKESLRELEELALHPKVVAIGEIGLDYYRKGAPVEIQKRVFEAQLELASSLGLPVIIHNRDAITDVSYFLSEWASKLITEQPQLANRPGVLHSYSEDLDTAEWAIDLNFLIGATGPVTFRNAVQLQQVVAAIPIEYLLIETDSPFLSPHPHRGERNEPAYVDIIAGKIAELREIEKHEIAQTTTRNAARLFHWRDID